MLGVLVYAGLALLRKSGSMGVVYGVVVVALFYLVALEVGLPVTSTLLQNFFGVFLVAMVVIFRDEIRRFFELLVPRRAAAGERGRAELLAKVLGDLAREKTGALVIVRGKDDIDPHLTGGTDLDGYLSESLLKSLFNRTAPSHDGAVVIEGMRVKKFGCHLPLSKRHDELRNYGTRHAAALGLAERTDATCLVVSEEKGKIVIAHDSMLEPVDSVRDFIGVLEGRDERHEPTASQRWRNVLFADVRTRLAAIVITAALWMVFGYGGRQVRESVLVPVEISQIPEGNNVELRPTHVLMTLSGPKRSFVLGRPRNLRVLVPFDELDSSTELFVEEHPLTLPNGVILHRVEPQRVEITLQ